MFIIVSPLLEGTALWHTLLCAPFLLSSVLYQAPGRKATTNHWI